MRWRPLSGSRPLRKRSLGTERRAAFVSVAFFATFVDEVVVIRTFSMDLSSFPSRSQTSAEAIDDSAEIDEASAPSGCG